MPKSLLFVLAAYAVAFAFNLWGLVQGDLSAMTAVRVILIASFLALATGFSGHFIRHATIVLALMFLLNIPGLLLTTTEYSWPQEKRKVEIEQNLISQFTMTSQDVRNHAKRYVEQAGLHVDVDAARTSEETAFVFTELIPLFVIALLRRNRPAIEAYYLSGAEVS